jgi:hypothetical protein
MKNEGHIELCFLILNLSEFSDRTGMRFPFLSDASNRGRCRVNATFNFKLGEIMLLNTKFTKTLLFVV